MAQQDAEVDLLEILARLIFIIKANKWAIVIAVSAGSVLGMTFFQLIPKVYETKMIVLSDILTTSYSENIAERLNNLIDENNLKELSEKLGLTETESMAINNIDIEAIQHSKGPAEESSTFVVTVSITNNSVLMPLQNGLINHLRNNEYVKIRVKQRQELYKSMIEQIETELSSLDSLKRKLFVGEAVFSKTAQMLLIDPTSIYSKILELTKEKINYEHSLEIVDSIQLVEGFTLYNKPTGRKPFLFLAGGAMLGLLVVSFLILLQSMSRMPRYSQEKLGRP